MILTNEFDVKAPIAEVWKLLDQIEGVVPCMPGASYVSREGHTHHTAIRLKLGAINTYFKGVLRIEEQDEATHTIRIRGSGKENGGKGAATAIVVATLEPRGTAGTHVIVQTDLAITGKIAQFGGGILADISSRLIAEFAQNLQKTLGARQVVQSPSEHIAQNPVTAVVLQKSDSASGPEEVSAVDLGPVILPAALSFTFKYIAVPVVFFVLGWLAGRHL